MLILDRYITKQFIQTIFFGLLVFIMIFVIIDMFEKLDDFIDKDVPKSIIFEYYIVFLPEIIRLILPVSVLLAGLFTVGKMVNQNELTAIKAAGVSIYRFIIPFLIIAFLISCFSIYFGGYTVPQANKRRVYIEQNHMKKGLVNAGTNIFFQDTKTKIVTISYYDVERDQANRISIQEFDDNKQINLKSRIDAEKMKFDSLTGSWVIINGYQRFFVDDSIKADKIDTLFINNLNFSPAEVIKKQRKPEEMTLTELSEYSKEILRTGNDPTRIEIEYHSRFAFAFSSLVVILFGLPISINKRRGGLAIQFGINLLITFIYLIFMKVSQSFGKNGVLEPIITAWIANFIFLAAAVFNLYRVRK
ncbi:MAG: LptF/LptG family permease [Melioribacteraceae bacterium]|nr:LptF/LptG family permease [Melioribacteraceae bacterium]